MSPSSPIVTYGRMIRFSHSIFALPFAFSGAALAAAVAGITAAQVGWIILAMVAARSAAMGFNRLVDRHIDAANPRTAQRELPQGVVSPLAVWILVVLSALALIGAAWKLNPLCLALSPVALFVVGGYSFTKRFTWGSHLVLGLGLGLAPLGAWIAVAGQFNPAPVLLGLAVMSWVAGFDILYSCQDHEYDKGVGLHSIPVRFGLVGALRLARILHVMTIVFMLCVGTVAGLRWIYFAGVGAITLLLCWEHRLVRPDDLTKVNTAFMTANSIISVAYFAFTLTDLLLLGDQPLWAVSVP
ncbi:MAG: UbiA family prenyltransferase [Gemmatimonadetes bacterium]|jgi:4-hydroxybenzoate polyprenyltransferase|nr:UbiA family prenyltransferase [Gemmatimonadota bacterium]MBT4612097.1 UbiA family prenyltransferase [Gemmatimonadota bacterium]MBT5054966.1 UbiA family prenyltransferase [Gemmatimonadota bacterium]MBT5145035.1 UbiA family prenyltransferase [Gemmatimonadota bacterium]MBT5592116.1 UbiA family prenyltransferase [Gemmatimonadota bacterium]